MEMEVWKKHLQTAQALNGYIEIKSIFNIDNEVVLFMNLRYEVESNANFVRKFAKLPSPSNKTIVTTINYCLNYHYSR